MGGGKTHQLGDVARERHKQGTWEVWGGQNEAGDMAGQRHEESVGRCGEECKRPSWETTCLGKYTRSSWSTCLVLRNCN